jgi:hypothetical protein
MACNDILEDVVDWLAEVGTPSDRESVLTDLVRSADQDAYTFAKNLDNSCFWAPDFDLVERLSNYSTWAAHTSVVKQWVEKHGITAPYAVGETVILRGEPAEIVEVRAETAQIVVQPVKPDGKSYGETGGWIHGFEEAKKAASAEA